MELLPHATFSLTGDKLVAATIADVSYYSATMEQGAAVKSAEPTRCTDSLYEGAFNLPGLSCHARSFGPVNHKPNDGTKTRVQTSQVRFVATPDAVCLLAVRKA